MEILKAYGIQAAGYKYAYTPKEAVAVANDLGYPVVMKINTPPILHKTEVGGVMVDLRSDKEVKKAFGELNRGWVRYRKVRSSRSSSSRWLPGRWRR